MELLDGGRGDLVLLARLFPQTEEDHLLEDPNYARQDTFPASEQPQTQKKQVFGSGLIAI